MPIVPHPWLPATPHSGGIARHPLRYRRRSTEDQHIWQRRIDGDEPRRESGRSRDGLVSHDPLESGHPGRVAGIAAGPRALEELCSVYWYPLYAFIRRKGNDPDRALDLTQDFFARLLEKDILAAIEHRKGRFRSFLRVACKNFLIDAWRHKRDVATTSISIDARDAEGRYLVEPADNLTPERLFDRAGRSRCSTA